MTTNEIVNLLLIELSSIGIMKWHVSKHGSVYLKFKDLRLGSIRVSDHIGRPKYNYRYKLIHGSTYSDVMKVIVSVISHSWSIDNFDPNVYRSGSMIFSGANEWKARIRDGNTGWNSGRTHLPK